MPVLTIRGGLALSSFASTSSTPGFGAPRAESLGVVRQFSAFRETDRALSDAERATLARLLTYGVPASGAGAAGVELVVTPRLGTISPWSSKATDIAKQCGLEPVRRIERERSSTS